MRALTPSCGSSECFFDEDTGREEETSSQGTDQAHQRVLQSQQPAAPLSFSSPAPHPRSRDPSRDPRNRGSLHCLLPAPFSTGREQNCCAKVYSNCLKRKGDDSLSVCRNSRLQTLSSITLPCSGRQEAQHSSSKASFAGQQS